MMECPNCGGTSRVVQRKVPSGVDYTVHRTHQCTGCKFQFKTSEKILFSTLPISVRNNYMEHGRKRK